MGGRRPVRQEAGGGADHWTGPAAAAARTDRQAKHNEPPSQLWASNGMNGGATGRPVSGPSLDPTITSTDRKI